MKFVFETEYTRKALADMAKCMRKTVRKKHNRIVRILGWFTGVLAVLLVMSSSQSAFSVREYVTVAAAAVMVTVLIFEDRINGWIAAKRMLKGTEKSVVVFDAEQPDFFTSQVGIGKSEFSYDTIAAVAETKDYFVFILNKTYGQLYDKKSLKGGNCEEFRSFIYSKTGKQITAVK